MPEEELIIRQSKWKLVCYALAMGAVAVCILKDFNKERSAFTIILGILFLALFGYFLYELIKRKPEIILTREGIYLRDAGFFIWDIVVSFSTADVGDESSNRKLVLHFSEFADKKNYIHSLEVDKDELIALILRYKGDASSFYSGHK
jgi:hypothetical protein